MRYYHYISDSKLEALYEQIPPKKRDRLAIELSINLGIIQARFQAETVQRARHQKLLMVERYLKGRTGTLMAPKKYVAGTAKAVWGPFDEYSNIVYFGGYRDTTYFALVGSLSNCIGGPGTGQPSGYSMSPSIVDLLARHRRLQPGTSSGLVTSIPRDDLRKDACVAVIMTNQLSIEPREEIQFFAHTVHYDMEVSEEKHAVYIASPIYVSDYGNEI